MSNIPPFAPGQRVVSLSDYTCPIPGYIEDYKKGEVFTVKDCIKSPRLKLWHVSFVGRKDPLDYYDPSNFAPMDQQFQAITYTQVMEIESPLISVQ